MLGIKRKAKQNKGFTLSELLIAVAILAVLAAVSIPLIVSAKKNLKFTELNDTAREIYISVQNKLMGEKSTGQLETLKEIAEGSYEAQKLTAAPQDFFTVENKNQDLWKQMFYFDSSDDTSRMYSYLVDETSLEKDLLNGSFIVEFNPSTGDVYGVFYAESDFAYTDVTAPNLKDRADSTRKKHNPMLGYYGGKIDATSAADLPSEFHVDAKVINSEELYLDFTCDNLYDLINTEERLTITVALKDQTTGAAVEETLQGRRDFQISGDKMRFRILLDSMQDGYHFSDIVRNGKFELSDGSSTYPTPGNNLDITIKVVFKLNEDSNIFIENGNGTYLATNSLFETRVQDGDTDKIEIGYVRHLNNLRASICQFAADQKVLISQVRDIDFLVDNYTWSGDEYLTSAVSPIAYFAPVVNATLNDQSEYDGAAREIRNFQIQSGGASGTGLFGTITGWKIHDLTMVDPIVSGTAKVGALAGSVSDCQILSCGVYLSTSDNEQVPFVNQTAVDEENYPNMMEERRAKYTVSSSSSYVGGLVGYASQTRISASFAAINTIGSRYAGGLVGQMNGGSIEISYSSGKINASRYAGGLVGQSSSAAVSSCYSTSDVTADSYAGGMTGVVSGGSYSNCTAYGKVCKSSGALDTSTSGGFYGSLSAGASLTGCVYLKQKDYNEDYSATNAAVTSQKYAQLALTEEAEKIPGYPYNINLYTKENCVFPFAKLEGESVHHGDWPMEYTIQVALVYYERYTDGDYGLYGITSMSTGETTGTDDGTRWLLNTLSDKKTCMEDGYAIMTVYQLSDFVYSLNDGSQQTVNIAKTPGAGMAVKLETESTLSFKKCKIDPQTGIIESLEKTDTAEEKAENQFAAKNLYIYQFPFELQDTSRNTTATFYDKFVIKSASSAEYTSNQILNNYTFFYNPHFAKNAINPNPMGENSAQTRNSSKPDDPQNVYVRSARQLNAIGRYCYYWNPGNNPNHDKFDFIQETDIDFSLYTKTYCGVHFDLMDTSEANRAYRNMPIGRPSTLNGKAWGFTNSYTGETYYPKNFQNIYDGTGHKIIDYCVSCAKDDNYQFVGLFGEVRKGILKNIVMTASDPANNSGYIENRYSDSSLTTGVGVLAGLVYRDTENGVEDDTKVINCAASGYTIIYTGGSGCGVGGLVGYNMGTIQNCSAVNKLVCATPTAANHYVAVGGLVGVNQYKISNCYSGGNLQIAGSKRLANMGSVGGLTGALNDIYSGPRNVTASISNCYTYCTPVSGSDTGKTQAHTGIAYYGTAYHGNSWSQKGFCKEQNVSGCYYLTDTVSNKLTLSDTEGTAAGCGYEQMMKLNLSGFGRADSTNSHPWNGQKGNYPFPAAVKASNDETYIHYGNWPLQTVAGGVFVYYEKYANGKFGYHYLDTDGALQTTLDDNETITMSGYGYLTNSDIASDSISLKVEDGASMTPTVSVSATPIATVQMLANGAEVSMQFSQLYLFDSAAIRAMTPEADKVKSTLAPDLEISVGSRGYNKVGSSILSSANNYDYRFYVNAGFAAAISANEKRLGISEAFQIRTQNNLAEISALSEGMPEAYIKFAVTRDVQVADAAVGGVNLAEFYRFDGQSHTITGLAKPLFDTCDGAVANVVLSASTLSDGAAMANTSNGVISDCSVKELSIVSGDQTAGFVYDNSGEIIRCSVNGTISAASGNAAGFVYLNESSGSLSSCSAVLSGLRGEEIGGFAYENAGMIDLCSVQLQAAAAGTSAAAGFARTCSGGASVKNCTVDLNGFNMEASNGAAAGFVLENLGHAEIQNCNVSSSAGSAMVKSAGGDAAGFVWKNGESSQYSASISGSGVSGIGVKSPASEASGFACYQYGSSRMSDNTVQSASVDGNVLAAGMILENSSSAENSVSGCRVLSGTVASAAGSAYGFAGDNSGSIYNSLVSGTTVTAQISAGGFFGSNYGAISSSTSSASVAAENTANGKAAGFGLMNGGTLNSCSASSTAKGALSSGFVFENGSSGTVSSCTVSGAAVLVNNSTGSAAGFVYTNNGSVGGSKLSSSSINAAITAGFVYQNERDISDCGVIESSVIGTATAAGFAYRNDAGTISRCAVLNGTVSGAYQASGFAGQNSGTINTCYVSGAVITSAQGNACGFANEAGTGIESCYSDCSISGSNACGFCATGTVSNCFALGSIAGTKTAYGFAQQADCTSCYSAAAASDSQTLKFEESGNTVSCYQFRTVEYSYYYGGYGVTYDDPENDVYFDSLIDDGLFSGSTWAVTYNSPYLILRGSFYTV